MCNNACVCVCAQACACGHIRVRVRVCVCVCVCVYMYVCANNACQDMHLPPEFFSSRNPSAVLITFVEDITQRAVVKPTDVVPPVTGKQSQRHSNMSQQTS